jgi:TolB-like protein/DNA-binding winged helix-turn-helix (wHTH) protein/Tfp pilus assembly protein PilF
MAAPIYRFGKFELCSGELRTDGVRVRMQEKPLLLLTALLENPQQMVTREELRHRLWSNGTFVDYEQGINVAVNKVRDSLGDSADAAEYIETIAKKGYRFLLTVEIVEPAVQPRTTFSEPAPPAPASTQTEVGRTGPSTLSRLILSTLLIAVVLAVVAIVVYMRLRRPAALQIKSIAVLPLQDLSADPGQEYFADGITEELITNLAQSLPLRVISRTSVMRFKKTTEPITQIARELGVDAIVEGAVARSGNRVTVTAQLIDASEDRHLWAQKYDRNLGDLLEMEAELSQEIAKQVRGTLAAPQEIKAAKSRPVNPQVYELCLLGRFHWNKRTASDLAKSAEYYQQAISRDPNYAPAYAGLANAYVLMPSYDSVDLRESYAKAAAAARHALDLDGGSAEPHATLGLIGISDGRADWIQTGHEFERALELNPNLATAHHWFSFYLFFSGRRDQALAEIEVARQLDPLSAVVNADEGQFLYATKRFEEAKARLRQAIALAPTFGQPHAALALVELKDQHPSNAAREAHIALVMDPNNPAMMAESGCVLAMTGQKAEARKLLAELNDLARKGKALPWLGAFIHIGLGERNEAIKALLETENRRFGARFAGFELDPLFDELNSDPRYQRLIAQEKQKMFLPRPNESR